MNKTKKKLTLPKETIRKLIPSELHEIAGGVITCAGGTCVDVQEGYTLACSIPPR
jgi:hypothetical protein